MRPTPTDYNTDEVESIALTATKFAYLNGRIDEHELERRVAILVGCAGKPERLNVLEAGIVDVVDVTIMGGPRQVIPSEWRWPPDY